MRSNQNKTMMCRTCGCKAEAKRFGLYMACPQCGGTDIVVADIWETFAPSAKPCPKPDRPAPAR